MLKLAQSQKIFLYREPVDMRNGIDGLMALIKRELKIDAFSGSLFVFLSRHRNRAKILQFGHGGFCLYYKRLEKNHFVVPKISSDQKALVLASWQLMALLDGIAVQKFKRLPLWVPKKPPKGDRQM